MKTGTLMLACVLLAVSAVHGQIVETPIPGDPVAIDTGLISGKVLSSGVRVYLGVPFADPPVREFRWRDPQPVKPWKGIYHADRKPSMCMQQMRAHDLNHYFGEESASEDCLYLNLWAPPAARPGERRPVLVFIYGGAFVQGTANMANYSGENLARKGVVYVAMNYRVGAFGFLAHPDLSAENGRKTSGNWGLLDQVAALQWIHRNIAKFGGDPENVTIMGQSAGSASVSYLQSSPLAKGLIHRVFGMSASAIVNGAAGRTATLAEAERGGVQFQEALKAKSLTDMRQLPADVIYAAQRAPGAPRFQPDVDNYLLPAMPNQIFAAGQQNDVPAMLGYMRDESTNALRTAKTVDDYKAAARRLFGDAADAYLALYPVATDADVATTGATAAREAGIESTMWFQTQDAYNIFRMTRRWTPYDRDLSDKLSDTLIAFAKTGNPNTPAIAWPRYDPANEQMIEFGDSIRVRRMNTVGLDFFAAHPAAALPASRDR
ncbi:MAG: carboxylesterase family protein [Acidobacteria bacterium]|nr:carboxylesterase family protein [Acidobacteriota bacterium]